MKNLQREYYNAFIGRNADYEGVFFTGIKTTGIFCRPTCSAREPKFENCEFFQTAQDALLAGYRPCKKCLPLVAPGSQTLIVKTLVDAVETEPEKRWTDADFKKLGVDSSTVRRQFKKRYGMTFVAYARARRMGIALQDIRNGASIIEAQLDAGYESGSGFRDAFSRIMGDVPSATRKIVLKSAWIDTPLGSMIAVADEENLYLLEFTDRRGLEREIERMREKLKAAIIPENNKITDSIRKELGQYFSGAIHTFNTPLSYTGSPFQQSVWELLRSISPGQTQSYAQLARALGKEKAVRAVANANGANQLAIIVPCHRVIGSDGSLTGYAGGLARKQWLLDHEKQFWRV